MPVIKALDDSFCGTRLWQHNIVSASLAKREIKGVCMIKIWDFLNTLAWLLWNGHGWYTSYLICPLKNGTTCCIYLMLHSHVASYMLFIIFSDWFGKAVKNVYLATNLNIFSVFLGASSSQMVACNKVYQKCQSF